MIDFILVVVDTVFLAYVKGMEFYCEKYQF